MTSDAKMGLLLGLVIVVVIAFLINGLPGLVSSSASETPVNTSIVKFSGDHTGIDEKAAQAVSAICMIQEETAQPIRYKAPLPVTRTIKLAPRPMRNRSADAKAVEKYLVRDGDNLGSIAKRVYGHEQGNKHVAVTSIYHANRSLLSSPDDLQVGQQLIIPVISLSSRTRTAQNPTDQTTMAEKMRSFADKNFKAIKTAVTGTKEVYIVQPGDSLWTIAEKTLADGSRYNEILRANSGIIDDEESISIGMKLKIPID
ncbi:MAG: LysM peptidoglycan-binding domain-containing protein [Planctomycetes bacterium]|nr:LysM peptidoglycan-binding domain-containing protein [Planctomycetota bacterium]